MARGSGRFLFLLGFCGLRGGFETLSHAFPVPPDRFFDGALQEFYKRFPGVGNVFRDNGFEAGREADSYSVELILIFFDRASLGFRCFVVCHVSSVYSGRFSLLITVLFYQPSKHIAIGNIVQTYMLAFVAFAQDNQNRPILVFLRVPQERPIVVFWCIATGLLVWISVFRCIQFSGLSWIFVFPRRYISVVDRFPRRLEFLFFGAISDNSNSYYYFLFRFRFLFHFRFRFRFRFRLRGSSCSVFAVLPIPWAAWRRFLGGGVAVYSRARSLDLARSRLSGGVGLLQVGCKFVASYKQVNSKF